MTGEERRIIDGLLAKDNKITKLFFFTKCRPMFHNMIHNIFRDNADYNELVNDLYLHLMEKDGRRLRSFGQNDNAVDNSQNNAYALIKWLKTTAWRYFVSIAEKEQSVAERRKFVINEDGEKIDVEIEDTGNKDPSIDIDFNVFFNMIKLERDREVLKKYFIEDLGPDVISEKLGISKENLYNIKKRALTRLQQAARHASSNECLCSVICEQYVLDIFGIHRSLDALHTLSRERGWLSETGVTLENIGTICKEFGLEVNSHSEGELNEIEKFIENGWQVIVAVDGGELTGNQLEEKIEDAIGCQISDHCVVILTIEDDSVTLYDPSFGYSPLTVNKEHFLDAWEDSKKYYVTINKQLC